MRWDDFKVGSKANLQIDEDCKQHQSAFSDRCHAAFQSELKAMKLIKSDANRADYIYCFHNRQIVSWVDAGWITKHEACLMLKSLLKLVRK